MTVINKYISIYSDCENFSIDPKDGTLALNEQLDREMKDRYMIDVTVFDLGIPSMSSFLQLVIDVMDVNDNAPVFTKNETTAYIIEKSPVGSVIALLTATDDDLGDNGTVIYSIESSNVSDYFQIDPILGLVRISRQIVINNLVEDGILASNETDGITLNLTVIASDNGSPTSLRAEVQLYVHLEPINDNAPVFDTSLYKFDNLTENMPNGKKIS